MSNKSKSQQDETGKKFGDSPLVDYADKMGGIGNTFISLSGLSYASGFIIINICLANKYGIYNFEILNARYIYSGASFLMICLIAYLGALYLANRAEKNKNKSWFEKIPDSVIWFTIINGLNAVIVQGVILIADSSGFKSTQDALSFFPIFPWFTFAMVIFSAQIYFLKKEHLDKMPIKLPFPSIVFTNFIILAALYGLSVYTFLPSSLGGGLPTPITLVIDKGKIDIAQQLLPVSQQSLSVTVYLIEQNESSYYILLSDPKSITSNSVLRAVQLNKSLVAGVIYSHDTTPP